MQRISSLLFIVLIFSGCSKVSHLPQLLTLKGMGDNRTLQKQQITRERGSFEKALSAYKENALSNYPDKKSVLKNIGVPLIVRATVRDDQPVERWLYRDPLKSFESEKVYLYFDDAGKLISWECIHPKLKSPSTHEADPKT